MSTTQHPPLEVPPPWHWRAAGPLWLLSQGAVPRAVLQLRCGTWEVSHADGVVVRDGVAPSRLAAVLHAHWSDLPAPAPAQPDPLDTDAP